MDTTGDANAIATAGQDTEAPATSTVSGFTPDDAFGLLRSYSRHRDYVRLALLYVIQDIERRSLVHDASKMLDDEFAGFARINALARINKFGSPEYSASMKRERATIDLHFSRNSHHPERPRLLGEAAEAQRGLPDDFTYWAARDGARMTFLDVIEMVCDWWGARKGYDDQRPWSESVELNFKSKGRLLTPEQLWLAREVAAFLSPESKEALLTLPVCPKQSETEETKDDTQIGRQS